ncbi:class I SAM-dependent methyltransferase [Paradesertivirga mongoliensis]|uniref:Class I SAM-dependent methyltransferase n=1 Tax=Paradesertivirga mongoliensis TaxID=2100740 RepID=A0ABW4ZPB2_9SPHI|nr:class I SAM-dependent methyltransferase [Pedobacter mongoliensis]
MKDIKDKFSNQAKQYQQFRPVYPQLLYSFLDSKVTAFDAAWDCGTGNGQVATQLAERFTEVCATDISEKQLAEASQKENIKYSLSRAEKTGYPDDKFDLTTVAQAVHWFDHDSFFKEVLRVSKPNAVVAIWGYNLLRISAEIDKLIDTFYGQTLGEYWDYERKLVEDEYKSMPFPFEEFEVPRFEIVANWDDQQVLGYFNSWSAVQNFIEKNGTNPVDDLAGQLSSYWQADETKKIRFRIFTRMGRVKK